MKLVCFRNRPRCIFCKISRSDVLSA